MAAIWRWAWTIAILALWPLTIGAYIQTRAPSSEPASKPDSTPVMEHRAPEPITRNYVICPFGPPCWQNGRRLKGALPGDFADEGPFPSP